MRLTERLNVLIQATTLSQKKGVFSLDDAVKAKSAIDVISAGVLNQNFAAAINILIEIVVESQKKGIYSLKDAHMIYLAVNGIEEELQNEVNRINGEMLSDEHNQHILQSDVVNNDENIISIPPKVLNKEN